MLRTAIIVSIILTIVSVGALLRTPRDFGRQKPASTPTNTLTPPLSTIEFPVKAIDYPAGWPSEIRYPTELVLVEAIPGTTPSGAQIWIAKLHYKGNGQSASNILISFFEKRGWKVVENDEGNSGSIFIIWGKKESSADAVI